MPVLIAFAVLMMILLWYLITFQPPVQELAINLLILIFIAVFLWSFWLSVTSISLTNVVKQFFILTVLVGIPATLVLFKIASPNPKRKTSRSRKTSSLRHQSVDTSTDTTKEQTDKTSKAELRLSTYLFFDGKQSARLVDGVQARFPDKPRQWCAEKALSDLERDRQMR